MAEQSGKSSSSTGEEERRLLAKKLDQDLEEFVASQKKTPYTEGWNEDTWEQVCYIIV